MKCFVLLATLVVAVSAESGADAEAQFFNGFGGQYGYPGYSHHGYARPLLASGYSTHSYHPYPAYHGGYPAAAYAAAAYAPRVAYPAVPNHPIAAPAPYVAAPAPIAPAAFAAQPAVPAPYAAVPLAAAPYAAAPLAAAPLPAAPLAPALPVGTTSSQFHSQDEFGNFDYSYSNINSAKHETGNGLTGVKGTYSYVDGFGAPQRVDYVADDFGFRATGTNFPTTAANLGLHRKRRELIAPLAIAPAVSAPAGHDAILTRIQLNPGHAVAYRVF